MVVSEVVLNVTLCPAAPLCVLHFQPAVQPKAPQQTSQQQQQQSPTTSSWLPDAPKDPQVLLQEAEDIRRLLLRNRYKGV